MQFFLGRLGLYKFISSLRHNASFCFLYQTSTINFAFNISLTELYIDYILKCTILNHKVKPNKIICTGRITNCNINSVFRCFIKLILNILENTEIPFDIKYFTSMLCVDSFPHIAKVRSRTLLYCLLTVKNSKVDQSSIGKSSSPKNKLYQELTLFLILFVIKE